MNDNLEEKLKQIKYEDGIWFIYLGIILLSWQANFFEADYYKNQNNRSKKKYRTIMIFIFTILLVVYYYFLKSAYSDLKKLKPNDSLKKKILINASYLGSLFIFISGIIFLLIALTDEELDVELAFN